jgi:O-antigen/teichoic acid export membrane protein
MKNPKQLLLKNIFSNWALMVTSAIIAFFLTPFLVHTLGKEEYGIWALVFSIIAYMNFFDVGMKQSLARYLSKHYATKDYDGLNAVINSSNLIYTITGSLVIIGTLVVAHFFLDSFSVAPELLPVMRTALIIIGFNQAVHFFFMTGTAIGPFHRYDISNAVEITFSIISALIVVYYLKKGHGLITLAIITITVNIVQSVVRRIVQQYLVPQIRWRFKYIDRKYVRELLGYGFVGFLIVISWMVIFNIDNVVVGIFLSTTAVTFYSIAGQMITYLRTIINAIGIPLVPAISHLDATSDTREIAGLYSKISKYLYYFSGCICVGLMFFAGKFIYLWMGPEFTDTVEILMILTIPVCVYLPQVMANSVLLGIGRHLPLFYVLAAEAVSNAALSLILVRPLGIHGVALGTAIPQLIIYLFVYPYVFHRIIKASLKGFYLTSAKMLATSALFTLPIAVLMKYVNHIPGWGGLFADIVLVGAFALAGFLWKVLDPEDRVKLLSKLKKTKSVNVSNHGR